MFLIHRLCRSQDVTFISGFLIQVDPTRCFDNHAYRCRDLVYKRLKITSTNRQSGEELVICICLKGELGEIT